MNYMLTLLQPLKFKPTIDEIIWFNITTISSKTCEYIVDT